MSTQLTISVLICLVLAAYAADVKSCPKRGKQVPSTAPANVTISNCPKAKCTLKRNTDVSIEMQFTPDRDFQELTSDINGIILNVPLPFPGVYGTSACPNVYDAEGATKVGCPVKAGETYVYKNSFRVLPVYPTVSLTIHWGLGDKQGDAACFEIPARIK